MTQFSRHSTTAEPRDTDVASARMPEVGRKAALEESFKALESYIDGGGLLKKGASGDAVAGLHRALNEIYGQPHFRKVGSFGDYTDNLVERFQREHRLEPDGIVGPKTLNALRKELARVTGGEVPAKAAAQAPAITNQPEPTDHVSLAPIAAHASVVQAPVSDQSRADWRAQATALAQAQRAAKDQPERSSRVQRASNHSAPQERVEHADQATVSTQKVSSTLRPSGASQVRQNQDADENGLKRYQTREEIKRDIGNGRLVQIPNLPGIEVDPSEIPAFRRAVLPHVVDFQQQLGQDFLRDNPKEPNLRISSAVRSVPDQLAIAENNSNAASVHGHTASAHLTAGAIDIARGGLSAKAEKWLDQYLAKAELQGRIEVTKEGGDGPCYHIYVAASETGSLQYAKK